MPEKLEKEIEEALRLMVAANGGLCLKWLCPGWAGVPDRIILLPGGRVLFAETKRPKGGKVGRLQKWWAEKLTKLGFKHVFVWSAADIKKVEYIIKGIKGGEKDA